MSGINLPAEEGWASKNLPQGLMLKGPAQGPRAKRQVFTVSVLGQDKGFTVKYNPLPEGVPEAEA